MPLVGITLKVLWIQAETVWIKSEPALDSSLGKDLFERRFRKTGRRLEIGTESVYTEILHG